MLLYCLRIHHINFIPYFSGNPALSSHTTLPVQVISRDMPVFSQQLYETTVLESLPPNSPLLSVTATSPHDRQLIYSLVSGNRKEDLWLDFNTGQISII